MRTITLLLLLAAAVLGPASTLAVAASDAKTTHCLQKTVVPGTTYYFPDGRASNDSAWVSVGQFKNQASYTSLYLAIDSTLGYDSPCSVRVECLYGVDDWDELDDDTLRLDSTVFYGYPTTSVVFNEPFYVAPEDSSQLISAGIYLADRHRWKVTVTDSASISLIEKIGKP